MNERLGGPGSGLQNGLAAALIALHGLVTWFARTGHVGTGGDDAFYIWLARAIRQGTYREIHRFSAPMHSQYPPGYATILALGGDYASSTDVATLIGIVASLVTLALLYDLCRRTTSPVISLVALGLAALNPLIIARNTGVFAEAMFTLAAMVGVWASVRYPSSGRAMLAATLASVAAAMFRSVGITVIGAILIARLIDRHPRRALEHAAIALVIVGPWLLWTFLAPAPAGDRSYVAAIGNRVERGYGPITALMRAAEQFPSQHFPLLMHAPSVRGTLVDNIFWSGSILVGLVIGLVASWRLSRMPALFFGCYLLLVGAWPFRPVRFLLPLIPVMVWFLALAAERLAERFRSRILVVVGAGIALAILGNEVRSNRALLERGARCRPGRTLACHHERAVAFFDVADWAKTNLPRDAIVATVKEATFAYYAERKVASQAWLVAHHGGRLLDYLADQRIRYVLMSSLHQSKLPARIKPDCRRFEVVHAVPPTAYLLHLADEELPAEQSACPAFEVWQGPTLGAAPPQQ